MIDRQKKKKHLQVVDQEDHAFVVSIDFYWSLLIPIDFLNAIAMSLSLFLFVPFVPVYQPQFLPRRL